MMLPISLLLALTTSTIKARECGPLVQADQKLTEAIQQEGFVTALHAAMLADGVLLFDAAPVLTGRDGPANIQSRLGKSPVAAAEWVWYPVLSFGSGDLGVTIGEARIGNGSNVFNSKYLTVWQRQPNGELRFIVDGGNSRPAR